MAASPKNTIIGFRHFEDVDAIKTYGFDGPLLQNEDNNRRVFETARRIISIAERQQSRTLRLIFSPSLRRIRESAHLVREEVSKTMTVVLEECDDLRPFDQGMPILPQDYRDGDRLLTTLDAWDAYCQATYVDRNIHYRFGDHDGNMVIQENLEGRFKALGESEADYLVRKYRFLLKILSQEDNSESVAFCSQTNPLLLYRELFAIQKEPIEPSPEELHFLCWRYFLDQICERSKRRAGLACGKDYLITEIARHDLAFGQAISFDLSDFDTAKWRKILMEAMSHLNEKEVLQEAIVP